MMADDLFIDHYKNLGVHFESTIQEIKQAFRKLAKLTHPDKKEGDTLSFLNIYSSYKILINKESKNIYDGQYKRYYFFFQTSSKKIEDSRFIKIPFHRIKYPTNISILLKHGLLGKRIKKSYLKHLLKVDYDMELHLEKNEFNNPICVTIPVTVRKSCSECWSANPLCQSCRGIGSYKTSSSVDVRFLGGLTVDSIIMIDLRKKEIKNSLYFKKKYLLLKVILNNLD